MATSAVKFDDHSASYVWQSICEYDILFELQEVERTLYQVKVVPRVGS